jgi:hypothetical protein
MAVINTLVINIKNGKGEEVLSPLYEVHSWADAEKIIETTEALIAGSLNPDNTFTFSVIGNS